MLNARREVLVVNQNHDSWSLPKGHIDPGETALEAARREIREESGITQLALIRELGTYERYKIKPGGGEDPSEAKTITFFLFETAQTALEPQDPDNPEARWVKKTQVAALLTHPKDREFFLKIMGEI